MKSGFLISVALHLAVIGLASVAAQAESVLYDCSFEQMGSRGGGWIPERLYVLHDRDAGSVEVVDPVIKHFVGAPIKGEVSRETAQRIGFFWTLKVKDPANQQYPMFYRFTYYKDGRPAQMSAQPGGYDNSWSGSGTCKRGKP